MISKFKNIKPLIIGMGLAGSRHLEAQLKLGIKTGVYNIRPEKTKPLKNNPDVIVFENLEDGIDWANLVHVCTPDDKHTEYVSLALKKGKAVLCEKPLTTNLAEALTLQRMVHEHSSTLIVGQNYRLTPSFLETKKLVSERAIGTVTGIETTYLDDMDNYRFGTKWRNMQDFLYVAGSHAVDLACWIIDEPVVSVQAATGIKIKSEYESQERYQIILKFKSGILGHVRLDCSSAQIVDGSDLIVYGKKGQLISHNKKDEFLFYQKGNKKARSIKLPNSQIFTTAEEVKIVDDYISDKITSHWPLPGIDEALNLIKVLDAVEKAAKSSIVEYVK